MDLKLKLVSSFSIFLFTFSCSENGESIPTHSNTGDNELPASVVLKIIPGGSFIMGGQPMLVMPRLLMYLFPHFKYLKRKLLTSNIVTF